MGRVPPRNNNTRQGREVSIQGPRESGKVTELANGWVSDQTFTMLISFHAAKRKCLYSLVFVLVSTSVAKIVYFTEVSFVKPPPPPSGPPYKGNLTIQDMPSGYFWPFYLLMEMFHMYPQINTSLWRLNWLSKGVHNPLHFRFAGWLSRKDCQFASTCNFNAACDDLFC